jgi:hypothetical protein
MPRRSIRGPHVDRHDARQPAQAVARLHGLCPDLRAAPHRLAHTQFADATSGTIRLKLFKVGALVKVSVRRIRFALASACPYADEWRLAAGRLARGSPF